MLTITYVTGDIKMFTAPAAFCDAVRRSLRFSKRSFSSCCRQRALTTFWPDALSRVASVTWSVSSCAFLYIGIVIAIMANTTTARTVTEIAKITPALTLTVKAMITEPITIMGDRSKSLSVMLTPERIFFTSFVMRVNSSEEPNLSRSA